MSESVHGFLPIVLAFALAGTVKGLLGLGLPPLAMGVLVLVMPPLEAAALLVLPALATNVRQALLGAYLTRLVRRFWPMLLAAAAATLAGTGLLARGEPELAIAALGVVLALYAANALLRAPLRLRGDGPRGTGLAVGAATGLATAATGVSAVPVVPYLEALGLSPDELVQAMGLSFTVSTVALGANLALSGAFSTAAGWPVAVALVTSLLAMQLGSALRSRMDPTRFRRLFLLALLGLGLYLATRAISMV